jgi:SAM-dependent methyltransferase
MSINYLFLLNIIDKYGEKNASLTVLDFGCGRGEIVKSARSKNINVYGADVFHSGSAIPTRLAKENLMGSVIREIIDDTLQFSDETFDLVVSNQVFEHVRDLDNVLKEILRVLKPDGVLFALFPPKEVIREGHTGIPFLHWFPRNKLRHIYTLILRHLGFGSEVSSPDASPKVWVDKKLNYMDTKTFYRSDKEIKSLFDKYFIWEHQEEEIINYRADELENILGTIIKLAMKVPGLNQFGIYLFTRLAGYLIVANPKKTNNSNDIII